MIRSMTALLLAVTLSAGIQAQAATANQETYYYSLGEPTITEIPDYGAMVPLAGMVQDCDKNISYHTSFSDETNVASAAGLVEGVGTVVVVLDQVINIGKKVFDVVRAGTPVVNIKRDTANALPSGLKCWSDLGGWKAPKATSYRVVYKNALGMEHLPEDEIVEETKDKAEDDEVAVLTSEEIASLKELAKAAPSLLALLNKPEETSEEINSS